MVMETEVFTEGGGREKWNKCLFLKEGIQLGELSRQQELPSRELAESSTSSSQITKQPSLPSWAQGNKIAGFLPFRGPVPKVPLNVQWLCILISSVTGWSEELQMVQLSKTCLLSAWQALMASPEQHLSRDFTRAVTLHRFPLLPVYLQLERCMGSIRADTMATLTPEIPDQFFPRNQCYI